MRELILKDGIEFATNLVPWEIAGTMRPGVQPGTL